MKLLKMLAPTIFVAVTAVACQQQATGDYIAAGEVNDLPESRMTAQPASADRQAGPAPVIEDGGAVQTS